MRTRIIISEIVGIVLVAPIALIPWIVAKAINLFLTELIKMRENIEKLWNQENNTKNLLLICHRKL
ncbi:MAG: hypothetical protein ABIH92_00115 [Nanoarchaeota archaeon]